MPWVPHMRWGLQQQVRLAAGCSPPSLPRPSTLGTVYLGTSPPSRLLVPSSRIKSLCNPPGVTGVLPGALPAGRAWSPGCLAPDLASHLHPGPRGSGTGAVPGSPHPTGINRSCPCPSRVRAPSPAPPRVPLLADLPKPCRSSTVNGNPLPRASGQLQPALRDIAAPRPQAHASCLCPAHRPRASTATTCVSTQRREVRSMDRKCKSHSHNSCQGQGRGVERECIFTAGTQFR